MTWHGQIKHMLLHISGNVAKKITFDLNFVFSKHQNFSFENCVWFRQKNKVKCWGDNSNILELGGTSTGTFSVQSKTQTSCDMAIIGTI